jgi:predicted flap endonuclease-1-like 5' DNA nuclease
MSYPIRKIEGIGPVFADKLAAVGITNTRRLLERCCAAKGRRAVAKDSGLDEGQLLKWANMADLMRVSGIGEEYSELLEAAGVDTVKELKLRRADNLRAKMAEVNATRELTRQLPSEKQVASWVEQASSMDPLITH